MVPAATVACPGIEVVSILKLDAAEPRLVLLIVCCPNMKDCGFSGTGGIVEIDLVLLSKLGDALRS